MTSEGPRNAIKDIARASAERAADTRDQAKDAASTAGSGVRDFVTRARENANDMLADVTARARDAGAVASEQAAAAAATGRQALGSSDALAKTVSRQPFEALLLAGAIGYLVGWAANRV